MSTNPNTPAANPYNFDEQKAVFEQANTWARNVNSSIWLVTSFFIGLNLVVIEAVLSNSENSHVKDLLEQLTCGQRVFLTIMILLALWLIPAVTALTMMVISDNLFSFVKNRGPFTSERLSMALTLEGSEGSQNPGKLEIPIKVLKKIKTFYGLIIASFTVLFGLVWSWIFFRLIS